MSEVGKSGEVAFAEPIVLQVPDAGSAHRMPPFSTAGTFGASTGAGKASPTVLLVA